MDGVTILNQTNIYETITYPSLFWVPLILFFLVGLYFCIKESIDLGFCSDCILYLVLFTLIGFLIGVPCYISIQPKSDIIDYIEYKVIISEDVNFHEFMDRYEIIDQEGKIYTVKETTND